MNSEDFHKRQELSAARDAFAAGRDLHVHLRHDSKKDSDASHYDALSVLNPPLGRLPPRIHGRDALLERLCQKLKGPDPHVHLLSGLGGVGKSTVALQVAMQARRQGRPAWWVYAANASTLAPSLLALAEALGADAGQIQAATVSRLDPSDVLWRQLEMRSGWLLVFDNADDPAALSVSGRLVRDGNGWIRPSETGMVLITSRDRNAQRWGTHVVPHEVSWLNDEDGGRVLLDLAPNCGSAMQAQQLSARMGGLPLALHHIGLYLSSPFAPEESFARLDERLNYRFPAVMGDKVHEDHTVIETWELSLQQLARQGIPQARTLLCVLARFVPGVPLPVHLLDESVLSSIHPGDLAEKVRNGLQALHDIGLLEVREIDCSARQPWATGAVLHPLVAEVFRRHSDLLPVTASDIGAPTAVAIAQNVLAAADCGDPEDANDWPKFAQLTVHIEELATAASAGRWCTEAFRNQVLTQCRYLYAAGQYSRARELADRALAHWRAYLPEDHPDIQNAQNRLGAALTKLNENARARDLFQDVLEKRIRTLKKDAPATLSVRNNLAISFKGLGDYQTARDLLIDLWRRQKSTIGADDLSTLRTANNLSNMHILMGEFEAAHALLIHVLKKRHSLLGPHHPETLVTAYYLGRSLRGLARYGEAHQILLETFRDYRRVLGTGHPETMMVARDLSCAIWDIGDQSSAIVLLAQVCDGQHSLLGQEHPDSLESQRLLADWKDCRARTHRPICDGDLHKLDSATSGADGFNVI